MPEFSHLHCHTQFSLLDGASDIDVMMAKAAKDGQKAVALTDHGNMFGAFKFVRSATRHGVKPIIGCEFYMVEDRHRQSFSKSLGQKDKRYHQLLLAKNEVGYQNLCKLASLGYIEGLYSKWPRIDKELIEKYSEGVIATSCCIGAEIPQAILHGDMEKAENLLKWWLNIFGEDYYIELQRHKGLENIDGIGRSQEDVNQALVQLARKHNVKIICTNDTHYVEEEDWLPHDILLCVNVGATLDKPNRFKFSSSDFYFKTKDEMAALFHDFPEALDNTIEIVDKVHTLQLERDILLPAFPLPSKFKTQEDYLRHLTYEGAKRHYGDIKAHVQERLEFELNTINKSGYAGYFLIVQDFTSTAREMGVSVGPGRGSAAGSAVAYCLGITNIDPIKYDLLFERFLNPERVSMPDIDIDFDDEGRNRVIEYVIDKYGKNQVAQIITYGAMKAKSSVRDVGRVLDIPISEVDKVAKMMPNNDKASLKAILNEESFKAVKPKLNDDDVSRANHIRQLAAGNDNIAKMLQFAERLEGSIRNTGIHACGVIITPDDITNYVPVSLAKDSDLLVSQFDNSVAEDAGLLKMDFLGLKTLTIIKDAIENIKESKGVEIDIEAVSLEDEKTYELFQAGSTIGIFQYESPGMQKHMKNLKPNKFEDLIAMNALYRPGPMQYIEDFIARKHGRQEITYDLDAMEEYLAETYGITVYQEQVMLLSQKLAGFSKGQADQLRKAMGKKKKKIIDEMFPIFKEGCEKNGHDIKTVEKIWKDWEAFASYAFNKSHATCYSFVAFQTAYLKANYPAEFMASVLNHNKNDISKINFFLKECKRMNIDVLGPDVNESNMKFNVNTNGQIRFGLSGLKGVGEGPVSELLKERNENGPFSGIYDIVKRVNLRAVNKKCIESLAISGALDSVDEGIRSMYFQPFDKYDTFLEYAIKFGNQYKAHMDQMSNSLFQDATENMFHQPKIPSCEPWPTILRLEKEKEVTGIYLSGHPLDDFNIEIQACTNTSLKYEEADMLGKKVRIAGYVTEAMSAVNKKGNGWSRFTVQDKVGSQTFMLFGENHLKYSHLAKKGEMIFIVGQYQKSKYNDRINFNFEFIKLLSDVGAENIKEIDILIPVHELSKEKLAGITALVFENKGPHALYITLMNDKMERVRLNSKSFKVQIEQPFVDVLEKLDLNYKIK